MNLEKRLIFLNGQSSNVEAQEPSKDVENSLEKYTALAKDATTERLMLGKELNVDKAALTKGKEINDELMRLYRENPDQMPSFQTEFKGRSITAKLESTADGESLGSVLYVDYGTENEAKINSLQDL